MASEYVAPSSDLPEGAIVGHGDFAVGNNGELFAVGRRCRHLRADLAEGTIDEDGCLVCPWHGAAYDVASGRMVRGPGGAFAHVPGLGTGLKTLTRALPLPRKKVTKVGGMCSSPTDR